MTREQRAAARAAAAAELTFIALGFAALTVVLVVRLLFYPRSLLLVGLAAAVVAAVAGTLRTGWLAEAEGRGNIGSWEVGLAVSAVGPLLLVGAAAVDAYIDSPDWHRVAVAAGVGGVLVTILDAVLLPAHIHRWWRVEDAAAPSSPRVLVAVRSRPALELPAVFIALPLTFYFSGSSDWVCCCSTLAIGFCWSGLLLGRATALTEFVRLVMKLAPEDRGFEVRNPYE